MSATKHNRYIYFVFIIRSVFASFSTESHTVSVGSKLGDRHTIGDAVIETPAGGAGAAGISAILIALVIIVTELCHWPLSASWHVSLLLSSMWHVSAAGSSVRWADKLSMNLVLDGLGRGWACVTAEHLEARVVIIVVIFIIVRGLPITVAAGWRCCDRKLLLFLSVVIIVCYDCVCVGTVPLCLPGAQTEHPVHPVTGAHLLILADARLLKNRV